MFTRGSMASVTLIGRVGSSEYKELLKDGKTCAILKFTVAVNYKKPGEMQEQITDWFECVIFGRRAERVRDYLNKGRRVAVKGRLRTSVWERSEGVRAKKTYIVAEELTLLDGAREKKEENEVPF